MRPFLGLVVVCLLGCSERPVVSQALVSEVEALTLAPAPQGVDVPVLGPVEVSFAPQSSAGDEGFLVVWSDDRGAEQDVAVARVSAGGTLLDRENLRPPATRPERSDPAAAFDGENYLLAWQERGDDAPYWVVRGILLGEDGRFASDPFAISTEDGFYDAVKPAVAFDGENFVVAWLLDDPTPTIEAARVSSSGVVLDETTRTLAAGATTGGDVSEPLLASDADGALLMYQTSAGAFLARVAADLDGFDGEPANLGPLSYSTLSLLPNGDDIWVGSLQGTGEARGVYVQRRNAETLEPRAEAALVGPASSTNFGAPALARVGATVLLASPPADGDAAVVAVTRFDLDGNVLGTAQRELFVGPRAQYGLSLSSNGENALLAWQDERHGGAAVYAGRVSEAGDALDATGKLVSLAVNKQELPIAAGNAQGFLLVWLDNREGSSRVYATALDAQGAVRRTAAVAVRSELVSRATLAVASDGTRYLVAWNEGVTDVSPLYGRFVGADGELESDVFPIAADAYDPRIAFGAGNYLVVGGRSEGSLWNAVATRVSPNGEVLDAAPVLVADDAFRPALASDGNAFLVAWSGDDEILGVRVGADGQPIDSTPQTLTPPDIQVSYYPELSFGGGQYLVVWRDSSPAAIRGARIDSDLDLLDTTPLDIVVQGSTSTGGTVPSFPAAAFDGSRHAVIWNSALVDNGGITYSTRLGGVTTTGSVQMPLTVSESDDSMSSIETRAIAATPNGRVLVAYTLYDDTAGYAVPRVRVRTYSTTDSTLGGGCNTNADCAEGSCVDGVCCESTCAGGNLDCRGCSLISGSSSNGACEPLPDDSACGERGSCNAGTCEEAPDPGSGGTAGAGSGGTSSGGTSSSSGGAGTSSGGSAASGGSGASMSQGGEGAGEAGDDGSGAGNAGRGGSGGSGTGGTSTGGTTSTGGAGTGGRAGATAGQAGIDGGRSARTSKDDGGCGCRVGGTKTSGPLALAWLALALGLARRRRVTRSDD